MESVENKRNCVAFVWLLELSLINGSNDLINTEEVRECCKSGNRRLIPRINHSKKAEVRYYSSELITSSKQW